MLPGLVTVIGAPWTVLPKGIHPATLAEVEREYAYNPPRKALFRGLSGALASLSAAGCIAVYLDGSYVTGKPVPGDYDACWDPSGVTPHLLDPVFLDFSNKRANQKLKYGGEFFPFNSDSGVGVPFIDFFQTERFTDARKGILLIDLTKESFR